MINDKKTKDVQEGGTVDKERFRHKVKEVREGEWIRDSIRARRFSGIETLEQGIDLIRFAIKMNEAVRKNVVRDNER